VADAEQLRLVGELVWVGPLRYLTLIYRQNKAATDLRYEPEAAGTLFPSDWTTNGVLEIGREDAGSWWRVTARDGVPLEEANQRFMRLKVTELP